MFNLGLGLSLMRGGGRAASDPAATLSDFSMSDVDDIWATINVTTDTGSGTIYWVIVPTAAAVPSEEQIKAGTDGGDNAATIDGSISVASSGAKTQLAYGLAVNTAYDTYVVQETAEFSNIVTAEFTTDASTIIVRHAEDGETTSLSSTTGTLSANVADSLGGSEAVGFVDNNQGTVGALLITVGSLTYNNGVNRVRVRLKRISSSSPNLWMRLVPGSTTATPDTHVNLTARNNSGATQNWATATVTDLDGVWMQVDGTINMAGADVTGTFLLNLGDANNDTTLLRDGTVSIAVHDFIISHS